MPYTKAPERINMLPSHAQKIFISAFNNAIKDNNEETANKIAWSAVKKAGYGKNAKGKWVKASETFIYTTKLNEGEDLPNTIEIMRTGKWQHPVYGLFEISDNTINDIVTNFDNKVRGIDISFDVEHGETSDKSQAVCWVKKLVKKGSSLLAEVDWTQFGKDKIKDKSFKYFSPEFKVKYTDNETGNSFNNVLLGGGLTNRPFIKHMSPIMLSESMQDDINNIATFSEFEEEKEEDFKMNKKLLEALKLSENATQENIDTAIQAIIDNNVKLSEKVTGLEDDNKALETQINSLADSKKNTDSENVKLSERLAGIELKLKESEFESIYTVALNEGKMTPAMKDVFKKQYLANPEATNEIIGCLPKVVSLTEIGSTQSQESEVSNLKLFEQKIVDIQTSKNIPYGQALREARNIHKDLFILANKERGVN